MSTQTVNIDIELTATLKADASKCDYGVPNSPSWYEYDNVRIGDKVVKIMGHEVALAVLPKGLRDDILNVLLGEIDDDGWED